MDTSELRKAERRKRTLLIYGTFGISALSLFVFTTWSLRHLIPPILIGALFAYLFRPLKTSFRASWLPDGLRIFLIFLIIGSGLAFMGRVVSEMTPGEKEQRELLVRLRYKMNIKYKEIMGLTKESAQGNWLHQMAGQETDPLIDRLNSLLALSPEQKKIFVEEHRGGKGENDAKYLQYFMETNRNFNYEHLKVADASTAAARGPASSSGGMISALLSTLSTWFIMPLVFVFLLLDNGQILHYLMSLIPNRYFELSMTIVEEFDKAVGKYLRGTLLECALVGLSLAVGFVLLGLDLKVSLFIGSAAGLANAIPFLGPFIGLVIGVGYALIVEQISPVLPFIDHENLLLAVAVVVGLVRLLDDVIYQPVILGSAVNLHPLIIILGVIGGSTIFGFAGMLFAVPTIVVCKVVLETLFRELRAYQII